MNYKTGIMKLLVSISIIALLLSCGSTKEVEIVKEETVQEEIKPQRNIPVKATIGEFKESDHVVINAVRIVGNTLFLDVSYSGGCKEHRFEFIGSPVILKTLPPKRSVQLYHDSNEDVCRELVTNTIEIDLKELTYQPIAGSEIVLLLKGWDDPITYIFE